MLCNTKDLERMIIQEEGLYYIFKCLNCGDEFPMLKCKANEKGKGRGKFCSKKCMNEMRSKIGNVKVPCDYCGKILKRHKHVSGGRNFCDQACKGNYDKQNHYVDCICEFCGNSFEVSGHVLKYGRGRFCSRECKDTWNRGENSPHWKGGVSFAPYCPEFNAAFRERVRDYWGRKCILCGMDEAEHEIKMIVHHVNYNKDTLCNDEQPLFVTLCKHCHPKTNFRRNWWEEYFFNWIMLYFNGVSY
ncbi:hypothetical protein [Methanobacterium sp. SMA-27]|uniref:hypothetical protein n=1 Tax=Methanobacterium sp. SMA-27 TaxID=1495336 RepID=UPI00064EB582|nr:hypothetical protein [Methanobacterium sp. SMA-27]